MKIQSVYIDGFKNLNNVKIDLDSITVLLALNNFGKSNVLSGIDFGMKFIQATNQNKKLMMSNSNLIPLNRWMPIRNYRFQMNILTKIDGIDYRVDYEFEFTWKYKEELDPCIIYESLKIRPEGKGRKYTQLVKRNEDGAFFKNSKSGRCITEINVDPVELVINKLYAFDNLFYKDLIKKLNNMKFYMENNLDPRSFYQPDPFVRKGEEDMTVDAENLPRVIYHLSEDHTDKYLLLKNVFKELFPDVEDIIVDKRDLNVKTETPLPEDAPFALSNAVYLLFVKDKNLIQPVNFSSMSDGAQRIFMILTKIILADVSDVSLIAIEEPENSVHPGLFQDYIYIISQLLDDCKIIITSHSPNIVSYFDPSWIHVGVNLHPEIANFFPFKKTGKKLLQQEANSLKMSTGDYLFSLLSDADVNWEEYLECEGYE